ncbi:hypothetical protein Tco_1106516 [Tanacetum coccineum]
MHNIHPRPGSALHYSHEENILNTLRYVRKDGREIFGMPIPDALLTDAIKSAPYYSSYFKHVTEYQRYLNEEHDKADDKSLEPASSQPPKPTLTPTESFKNDQGKMLIEHEHVVMNPTPAGMRHHHLHLYIQRISLTGFPAQSVGSSNTYVLDLPCLLVLITGTSQSRQHGKSESDSYYLSD